MRKRRVHIVLMVTAFGFIHVAAQQPAPRIDSGVEVQFVVRGGTELTVGPEGDVVIFTGRSQGTVTVGDCASPNVVHVQTATVVDPGDGRATRLSTILVTSRSDMPVAGDEVPPVPSGTRLGNLSSLGRCAGGQFDKYRGMAQ